ncbi:Imm21 family immunity protein [Chitinimonas koreensis]|uniref:Imm21 family immunity protein n=1 Tax=Chitinimonas koreensis TaxID=356302 RepID=UPI00165424B8|nr:Imm21 family immunity protein [Chitinimonas koreensis]QNM98709.1 hypothetical protein H9L41_11095 [Chitinimonas koreensis]
MHQWRGVEGSSTAAALAEGYANDYQMACSVQDYLGVIELDSGNALILGDMPLETRTWHCKDGFFSIVRIFYADPDVDVIQLLEDAGDIDAMDSVESVDVEIKTGELVLFDSAYPGWDMGDMHLFFNIPPGKYTIITKQCEPDDRTSVLIHQFGSPQIVSMATSALPSPLSR